MRNQRTNPAYTHAPRRREVKNWFNLKYEILYFYNVYGPKQISAGPMATVIGIFENQYKTNKALTVVKPGNQSRRFTHINDTVDACFYAWKKNNEGSSPASSNPYVFHSSVLSLEASK